MKRKDNTKLRWPITSEEHQYLERMRKQNRLLSRRNPAENWMRAHLSTTRYLWTRQSRWGYRIFDFWCHGLGIAVEVDGSTHNRGYDLYRDNANFNKSGILVIRVKNFNEDDAKKALEMIARACSWNDRRRELGLKPVKNANKENSMFKSWLKEIEQRKELLGSTPEKPTRNLNTDQNSPH